MQFSVCVSALFPALSVQQAIARVREAGYDRYEFWGWRGVDVPAVCRAQKAQGVLPAALCTSVFALNDPAMRDAYLRGLADTLAVAGRLGCRTVITQVGQTLARLSRREQAQSILDGLAACVPLLEDAGATLVFEPLNTRFDHPGYFLERSDEAFQIARAVGSPRVKVLFDVYHQQITEGNLIPTLTDNAAWIGHVHIAGHPGRHEPFGANEIHYPAVLAALEAAGYQGAVGLEYFPLLDAVESLKQCRKELGR